MSREQTGNCWTTAGAIPGLTRTTFITGFPGETEEQFEELEAFVRQHRFERMGVFTYSLEPGTPADRLEDQLPEALKEEHAQTAHDGPTGDFPGA